MSESKFSPVHSIERLLPQEFLLALGTYVQTCAHIELLACGLALCLEGRRPSDPNWFELYGQTRKLGTTDLRKKLERASKNAGEFGLEQDLKDLCNWIKHFASNRHIAVHGAFVGSPLGFQRVDYLHTERRDGGTKYHYERTPITKELVTNALTDADRIYLILSGMLEHMKVGLSNDIYHAAVPIVVHPGR